MRSRPTTASAIVGAGNSSWGSDMKLSGSIALNLPKATSHRPNSSPVSVSQPPQNPAELQQYLRYNIRNENDSLIVQWSRLREAIMIEDRAREKVLHFQSLANRSLPLNVAKLIGSLKASVHKTMRNKGGTPFSIIREMFLYWDRENTGLADETVLTNCMKSLGVKAGRGDILAMLDHYSQAAGFIHHPSAEIDKNVKVMSYMDLMRDVLKGEPSTTVSIDVDKVEREDGVMRLEMRDDQFKVKPQVVNELLEAIRLSVARKMHKEGGTLFSHVRKAFYAADWDYSNALNACEFIFAMKKGLGLTVSPAQSQAIVAFYSRDGSGEFDYRLILADIVEDAPKLLDFVEAPPTQNKTVNPFVPSVFRPRPNKTFELIRTRVVIALEKKMLFKGGSLRSWLREAFTSWDPLLMGKLSCWQHVQGAFKALGVEITKQEAECILDCFSETKNGEIRYSDLVDAIAPADTSFLYPEVVGLPPASARAPTNVTTATSAFYKKVLRYADQSFGAVQPRDVLYGSFLRFDPAATGKVGLMELKAVAATLKVNLSESSLEDLLSWFDSDGSKSMDYLEFVRQLFGDDVATSTGKGLLLKEQEKGGNIVRGRVYVPMQRNQSSFTSPSSLLPTMASSQNPKMKSLKEARKKLKIKHLLAEKIRLRNKLDSIELQSKALVTQQKVKDGFVLPKKYI